MVRHNPGQPAYEDPNLFAGGGIGARDSHPVKRGFWLNLFLAHPILMLGGMWVLLVLIASIAFSGLLDPGVKDPLKLPPMELFRSSENTQSGSNQAAHSNTQPSDPTKSQSVSASSLDEISNPAAPHQLSYISGPRIPVWSLGALVLSCAAGCLVINHYLNATPSHAVKTLRQSKHPKPSSTPTLRSLKRLKPYTAPKAPPLEPPRQRSASLSPSHKCQPADIPFC